MVMVGESGVLSFSGLASLMASDGRLDVLLERSLGCDESEIFFVIPKPRPSPFAST